MIPEVLRSGGQGVPIADVWHDSEPFCGSPRWLPRHPSRQLPDLRLRCGKRKKSGL